MIENILGQIIDFVHGFIPGWLITVAKVIFYFILVVVGFQILHIILQLLVRFVAGLCRIIVRIIWEILPYALGVGIVGYVGRYVWRRLSIKEHLSAIHIDVHSIFGWLQGHGIVAFFEYSILLLVGGFIVWRFVILFLRFGWLDFLTDDLVGSSSGISRSVSSSRSSSSYDDDFSTRPSNESDDARRQREEEELAERRHREKIDSARREKEWETAMHNLYGSDESARRAQEAAEREEQLKQSSW